MKYRFAEPPAELADLVFRFWRIENDSDETRDVVVLPDGSIDVMFSYSNSEPYNAMLMGLGTHASESRIHPRAVMCAVSLHLLAAEHVLRMRVANVLDSVLPLPAGHWGINESELHDLETFREKALHSIQAGLVPRMDERKRILFRMINDRQGNISVEELAEHTGWSARQMNRYFSEWFGVSLKKYCTMLRFRASFEQIEAGRLFPEQDFADQPHFIREVKKFAGVTPKELCRNINDRFVQFSALRAG